MPGDEQSTPAAIDAHDASLQTRPSNYPEPFQPRVAGREKRPLGDLFGLANFGINLTRLAPGGESALMHRHSHQDEFIYIIEGAPTLVTDDGEIVLGPGMCAGFPADGVAHQLVNRSGGDVVFLEIGDRSAGDSVTYPADDLKLVPGDDGKRLFVHKDGSSF